MSPDDTIVLIPMFMFMGLVLTLLWIGISGSSNG